MGICGITVLQRAKLGLFLNFVAIMVDKDLILFYGERKSHYFSDYDLYQVGRRQYFLFVPVYDKITSYEDKILGCV